MPSHRSTVLVVAGVLALVPGTDTRAGRGRSCGGGQPGAAVSAPSAALVLDLGSLSGG